MTHTPSTLSTSGPHAAGTPGRLATLVAALAAFGLSACGGGSGSLGLAAGTATTGTSSASTQPADTSSSLAVPSSVTASDSGSSDTAAVSTATASADSGTTTPTVATTPATTATSIDTAFVATATPTATPAPVVTPPTPVVSAAPAATGNWGTALKPFAAQSLWNSRPVNPRLGSYVLPQTLYFPTVDAGAYSTGVFVAQSWQGAMTIWGPDGSSGVWDPDTLSQRVVTIAHWPSDVLPASGLDGHAEIVDPTAGVIHSFYQLRQVNGRWTASQYAWSPLGGTGWGDPAHPYQGARATGVPSLGGLIRKHEVDDGDSLYRHALAMSLDFSALSANPIYVFPATMADSDAAASNRGQIPEGALMMLPAGFDTSRIQNAQLRKVAETLKVYGARVVDRNSETRFAIYAEQGSSFNLMPTGWDASVKDELIVIADALRMMAGSDGWVDGNGQAFTPTQKLNLMSMRGPWSVRTGSAGNTNGAFDSASQSLVFPATGTASTVHQTDKTWLGQTLWTQIKPNTSYRFSVSATGGATLKLEFRNGSYGVITQTAALGQGQSLVFTTPSDVGWPILVATSGTGQASSVSGQLVEQ